MRYLCHTSYDDDPRLWIGYAWDEFSPHSPGFRGGGQFGLYILALRKQSNRACFQQRAGVTHQLFQWRQSAGGNDIERLYRRADKILDSPRVHNGWNTQDARGLAKERRFFLITLDQMDFGAGIVRHRAREDKSGKPPA